jgi:hypothetical protein
VLKMLINCSCKKENGGGPSGPPPLSHVSLAGASAPLSVGLTA